MFMSIAAILSLKVEDNGVAENYLNRNYTKAKTKTLKFENYIHILILDQKLLSKPLLPT